MYNKKKMNENVITRNMMVAGKKLVPLLVRISPVLTTKFIYAVLNGKRLDLKEPKTYHDKIHWLKLYWQHPLVAKCADKYEVRTFVEERGCTEILNKLYGVYDNENEIDWEQLPEIFVLKTTNACKTNVFCMNKEDLEKQEVLKKLNKWLKIDYGMKTTEIHYSKIIPRIICEKYIETEDGLLPDDYKVFCFNGKAKFILAIYGRYTDDIRMQDFDLNWNELDYVKEDRLGNLHSKIRKPRTLEKMIYYSEELSKGFPFVRVDFYDSEEIPIFGEMTFVPGGGYETIFKEDATSLFGSWIELPDRFKGD